MMREKILIEYSWLTSGQFLHLEKNFQNQAPEYFTVPRAERPYKDPVFSKSKGPTTTAGMLGRGPASPVHVPFQVRSKGSSQNGAAFIVER